MAVDAALGVVLEVELLDGMGFPPSGALGEALTHRVPVGLSVVVGRPLGKREALRGALAGDGHNCALRAVVLPRARVKL